MSTAVLRRYGLIRMDPRDPAQHHRSASPLELFFDLIFVVAVSVSSAQLHHLEAENHIVGGVGAYLMVFFAIWWAWMNFTWFATSFDTDDWLYRLATFVQMAGALVLAAGATAAMQDADFTVMTIGYAIMRVPQIGQWLRVALSVPALRRTALRYAGGIAAVQALWLLRLLLPPSLGLASFLVLMILEVLTPVIAERAGNTPWHPEHIAERYGCFTLILLGESILASTTAVIHALDENEHLSALFQVAGSGLVLAAGMWWVYFSRDSHDRVGGFGGTMVFGYFHYVIFAAAGAFSAGIEVAIAYDTHATDLQSVVAAATTTIPVMLFLLGTWWLNLRPVLPRRGSVTVVVVSVILGLTALLPVGLLGAAGCMVLLVVVLEVSRNRDRLRH